MTVMRKIGCLALSGALLLSGFVFSGCDNSSGGGKGLFPEEEKATLTFLRGGNEIESDTEAMKQFAEKYGKEVEIAICQYDEEQSKVVTSIAAGDPYDVVALSVSHFPLFAKQSWVQPLDDLIDMNSEELGKNVMENMFSYNGKIYLAAGIKSISPYVLYYNKTLFENEGLPDPIKYYNEGNWNWETFMKVCARFTGDTDGDGVIDRWGYAGWYRDSFYGLNHCSPVNIDEQGNYVLNLDDPKVIRSLEMMREMWYTKKYAGIEGDSIYDSFYQGKNAFLNEYTWAEKNIIQAQKDGICDFEYGVVPAPYGPDNTEKTNLVHAGGFSIVSGSDCPKYAGKFLETLLEVGNDMAEEGNAEIPEENRKLYEELSKNGWTDRLYDNCINYGNDLNSDVIAGKDITAAVSEWKPQYERKIEEANQPPETPVIKPFTTIDLKFETDDKSIVVNPKKADVEGLSVEWVTGADAIDGSGSLRINVTPETNDGDKIDAAITGESVEVLPWHTYTISFQYRVSEIQGSYYIGIMDTQKKKYEMLEFTPAAAGEVQEFTHEYEAIGTNTDSLVFLIGCKGASAITIDNFHVAEKTTTEATE